MKPAENKTHSDPQTEHTQDDPVRRLISANLGITPVLTPLLSPTFANKQPAFTAEGYPSLFSGSPNIENPGIANSITGKPSGGSSSTGNTNTGTPIVGNPSPNKHKPLSNESDLQEPNFEDCEFTLKVNIDKLRVTGTPHHKNSRNNSRNTVRPGAETTAQKAPANYLSIDALLNPQHDV